MCVDRLRVWRHERKTERHQHDKPTIVEESHALNPLPLGYAVTLGRFGAIPVVSGSGGTAFTQRLLLGVLPSPAAIARHP